MDQEFTKLKDIIADVLNVDPEEIRLDSTFSEDLGADSLDLYQIVMGIEEEGPDGNRGEGDDRRRGA